MNVNLIQSPNLTLDDPQAKAASILIVDDDQAIQDFERRVLEGGGYYCATAANSEDARTQLAERAFELVLVDINMPGESGLLLAQCIDTEYPDTGILMVTGEADPKVARLALNAGASGYLVKPFEAHRLLIDVECALRRRMVELESRQQHRKLEELFSIRTAELSDTIERLAQGADNLHASQEETILLLARAGESRCDKGGQHVQRMSRYCALIARRLGWDESHCETIRLASMLHDVGKIGVPDGVLLKQGPLTGDEFAIVKQHVDLGRRILQRMNAGPLQMAATIAWTHHERYDGNGYSRRLAGETIPLEGRIAAIADVFDALTSTKVYRPAYPLKTAVEIVRRGKGSQFDPALVDLFLQSLEEVVAIKSQHPDL